MGIIRKTFMFWLITGLIAALVITLFIPKLKTKIIEKIPGRNEAVKLVQQAKTAIKKHLPGSPLSASKVEQKIEEESIDESAHQLVQDSIKDRDDKLFKRQCNILDDLL